MSVVQKTPDIQDNLAFLRDESLIFILRFTIGVCFAWFVWWANTVYLFDYSTLFWLGLMVLGLSVVGSGYLRKTHLHLATHVLVWGVLASVTCLVFSFSLFGILFLFILPIIFASALLSQRATLAVTGGALVLAIIAGYTRLEVPPLPNDGFVAFLVLGVLRQFISVNIGLPLATIIIVAATTWVSSRSVYTALAWVWQGYEHARANEELARENQAELKRVLKSLDDALYGLERANYKLLLARNQAEEARRVKQQFVQTISHELRTPLNLIVSFTELMAQSPEHYGTQLPLAYLRDLSIVYRNASHLQHLVNDVLDLARIEAAQMTIVPEKTDPEALVNEAVDTAQSLIEARGLSLATDIEPGLPALQIDPTRIRQVLFNLLNNAARFTDEGGVAIEVSHQNSNILFKVSDTGVGIAPDDIPRIFEEFRQVDGSSRRRHGGAGLGLVICKRFIELHGGTIWVESEVGQGSQFCFSLPVGEMEPDPTPESRPGHETTPPAGRQEEAVVLAVTRSPLAVAMLTRYLQGAHTLVVQNLAQAEQAVQQSKPQLIVIDRTCEDLDPLQIESLGHRWGLRYTPIIVCPLPGEEPLRQRLAVDGYLLKPISRQALNDTLRQLGTKIDRILIIDDDHDFVLLLSRILEDNPIRRYRVVGAGRGQEGLALIEDHPPDVILLDLVLPDIAGLEVIERIRANPKWQHIPIIVVSAQDELDDREALKGIMMVAKPNGLQSGDVVRWLQDVLDETMQRASSEDDAISSAGPSAPKVMPVL